MSRFVRCNALLLLAAIFITMTTGAGCLEPSNKYRGKVRNDSQWDLAVHDPGNYADIFGLHPGGGFGSTVTGSTLIHCHAELPDATVYADFTFRVNSVRRDAPVENVQLDWAWIIDGPVMAAMTPFDPNESTSSYQVTINYFRSQVSDMNAPTVMIVSARELSDVQKLMTSGTHQQLVDRVCEIARLHGVRDASKLFQSHNPLNTPSVHEEVK